MTNDDNSYKHLVKVIQQLSFAQNLTDLMAIVRTAVRKFTAADGVTFVLRDEDACFYADEEAISPLWLGQRIPMEMCICGWSMRHHETVVIEDIYQDARIPFEIYSPTFVKSLLIVPIRTFSPLGTIGVYWAYKYRPTAEQIALVQTLADSTSIAIENLHLTQQINARLTDLEKINRGKDEFLMIISHELRTPLNSILGFASLLASGTLDQEKAALAAKTIETNALAQSRIISDILDATRIISGRFSLEKKPLEITDIVTHSIESAEASAKEKEITIIHRGTKQSWGKLHGDQHRLQQIFWNLISNAIKFTPRGGIIEITLERRGPNIHIRIQDNGEGIADEDLARIFERFYQVDSSSIRKHGGLGIGLAIVKHLVEAHGGQITASSEGVGKGSAFDVTLPLMALPQPQHQANQELASAPLQGVRALAVDDDADAQLLVSIILRKNGAEVLTVDNTRDAMDAIMESPKDLLICDYNMPEEDGFAFMRRLRSLDVYSDRRLPAIALTAFADKEHERSAFDVGYDAFIGKPLQPATLISTAKALLQRA
jgi:two-component system CheB/CheR fusion protein